MIGYEIELIDQLGGYVDSAGPFFDRYSYGFKKEVRDIAEWMKAEGGKVEVSTNEYWGDESEYDFNDCFGRKVYDLEQFLAEFGRLLPEETKGVQS